VVVRPPAVALLVEALDAPTDLLLADRAAGTAAVVEAARPRAPAADTTERMIR
jgi:hypothetical protein